MNILITGASRGIGYETSLRLVSMGHSVLAVARDAEALEKLKAAAGALRTGGELHTAVFDISSGNIASFAENTVRSIFPRVHVLLNNAGKLISKPFDKITRAEIEGVYRVNVFGAFELIQHILPLMSAGGSSVTTATAGGERLGERLVQGQVRQKVSAQSAGAHIVNISSMGGITGTAKFAGLSAYSSSKGALSILTECLAVELKEKNISVNALALGAVQTEMLSRAFPGLRAPLSAKQAAEFIADFAVSGHRYFNGKVLPVSLSTP